MPEQAPAQPQAAAGQQEESRFQQILGIAQVSALIVAEFSVC